MKTNQQNPMLLCWTKLSRNSFSQYFKKRDKELSKKIFKNYFEFYSLFCLISYILELCNRRNSDLQS